MKPALTTWVLVGGLLSACGALAADSMPEPKSANQQINDAHYEMRILTALSRNPHLQAFDFSVSVGAGTVVLGGTVDDDINRILAGKIAIDVDGVKSVVNHIVVDANYTRLRKHALI